MQDWSTQSWEVNAYMPEHDMDIALPMFADHIRSKAPYSKPTISFEKGSKYLRVVKTDDGWARSAYAFIVLRNTGKFQIGDILKPASWKTPAKNFARGNVLRPITYQNFSPYGL